MVHFALHESRIYRYPSMQLSILVLLQLKPVQIAKLKFGYSESVN